MTVRLRWKGNIDAQRRADAAFARLKPKRNPTKSRKKSKKARGQRRWHRESFTGTYTEYMNSVQWKEKKAVVYAYYGRKCSDCGSTENLEVHHLSYKRLGSERMQDLQVLCAACHRIRHEDKPGVVTIDYMSQQFQEMFG